MRFKVKPSKEFISQRDAKVKQDERDNPHFFWDSELPEWHQCEVDPKQTMYPGWYFDTIHEDLGHIDYKLYSKAGVHVSKAIQNQVKTGNIDYFGIWMWANGHKQLKEGVEVEYDLLGFVDAKEALKLLDPKTNRFEFNLEDCVQPQGNMV